MNIFVLSFSCAIHSMKFSKSVRHSVFIIKETMLQLLIPMLVVSYAVIMQVTTAPTHSYLISLVNVAIVPFNGKWSPSVTDMDDTRKLTTTTQVIENSLYALLKEPHAVAHQEYIRAVHGPHYTINNSPEHSKPYVEVHNATYHGYGPREEARAMCSVKTQEVNATANATITRRLHGVVTSRELHNAVQRLEVIIFGQMQQLWQSLDALRAQYVGESRVSYPDRRSVMFRYKP